MVNDKYKDMIKLKYCKSSRHPHLPLSKRAAQFMPFAPLNGYEDALKDARKVSFLKKELTEQQQEILDYRIQEILQEPLPSKLIKIVYWRKIIGTNRGNYLEIIASIKEVSQEFNYLILENGLKIKFCDIYNFNLV